MFLEAFEKAAEVAPLKLNPKGPLGMSGPAPKMPSPPAFKLNPKFEPKKSTWNPSMGSGRAVAPPESQASVDATTNREMGIK